GTKVVVTGRSVGSAGNGDYATVAYNATSGAQLWAARYDGPAGGDDFAMSLAVSRDSTKVLVTGRSFGSTGSNDYATVAYDSSDGAQLWASRYDGPAEGEDVAKSVAVSPDGTKVAVTGYSASAS